MNHAFAHTARLLTALTITAIALGTPSLAAAANRATDLLRNQKLPGMDYRHFTPRDYSECRDACAVEARCRSWSYRPYRRNNTFDNADDGPTCFLKTGVPSREYARGYVSGVKPAPDARAARTGKLPPPPAVAGKVREQPPPPVVAGKVREQPAPPVVAASGPSGQQRASSTSTTNDRGIINPSDRASGRDAYKATPERSRRSADPRNSGITSVDSNQAETLSRRRPHERSDPRAAAFDAFLPPRPEAKPWTDPGQSKSSR